MVRVRIADIGQSLIEVSSVDLPALFFVTADRDTAIERASSIIRELMQTEVDVETIDVVQKLASDDAAETILFATTFTRRSPTQQEPSP